MDAANSVREALRAKLSEATKYCSEHEKLGV